MENPSKSSHWREYLLTAIQACRRGREVLLHHLGRLEKIEKKFQAGLVSEADKESERVMTEYLLRAFPESEMLGEESAAAGTKVQAGRGGPHGRWILDPLDGTTNYIHRFPIFCISLGLEVDADLKVAVIDVPMLNETYTAIKGEGAFVNGRRIHVSDTTNFGDSLLATGFFAENKTLLEEQLKIFTDLVHEARGIRRAGAAAYDLCQVARGVFDGYWEKNLSPWDVAAGQLLVEEAGGVVTTYDGRPHDPYSRSMIASNRALAPEFAKRFAKFRAGS